MKKATPFVPLTNEQGIIKKEGIYFHDVSEFAKKYLYYPHWGATYTCVPPYQVKREGGSYPKVYLIMYVLEGEFHMEMEGRHIVARTDELFLIDCSREHHYWVESPCTFQWLHFEGSLCPEYYDLLSRQSVCHSNCPEVSLLLSQILNHLKANTSNEHRLSCYIYDILTRLTYPTARRQNDSIRTALHYMEHHFRERLSIKDLAGHVSLNQYYFAKLFKQETGSTPHAYLLSLQLNHAKYLLSETRLTVQEIADECGFTSSTNFIRTFKEKTAVTPTQFRKYFHPTGFQF